MTLRLNGSTSGFTEIDSPAVGGNNTLVLPANNGTTGQFLQTNGSGGLGWADALGSRNRIINGDMRIDQRNGGASVTSAGPIYTVDRWSWLYQSGSGHTIQQSTDAPAGFLNSLKVTVGTGASPSASQQNIIWQPIEGYNVADLGFGAAGASTITFSFWVKSSLVGTFNIWLQNSANSRSYASTYTISAANTWEQKSITVAGDTTGTWLKTNGTGFLIGWSLGCGSNFNTTANTWASADYKSTSASASVVGTSGATFFLTGAQAEPGTVATPFERRSYGQELALCQRYFQRLDVNLYGSYSTGTSRAVWSFKVTMRAVPTIVSTGSAGTVGAGVNHAFKDLANSDAGWGVDTTVSAEL
jgi:hypothetical protein